MAEYKFDTVPGTLVGAAKEFAPNPSIVAAIKETYDALAAGKPLFKALTVPTAEVASLQDLVRRNAYNLGPEYGVRFRVDDLGNGNSKLRFQGKPRSKRKA